MAIGLISTCLDSFFECPDALGFYIKKHAIIWYRRSFSLVNLHMARNALAEAAQRQKLSLPIISTVEWENDLIQLAETESNIVVADVKQVSLYSLTSGTVTRFNLAPQTILLNPELKKNIIACVSIDKELYYIDETGGGPLKLTVSNVSFITWSKKGKQIACGTSKGEILFFDTDGTLKKKFEKPDSLSKDVSVVFIEWVNNTCFVVVYSCLETGERFAFQILEGKDKTKSFNALDDPASTFGPCDRPLLYMSESLSSWGFDTLLIVANSTSTDVGLIGASEGSSTLENWWPLEAYQITMPLDENQDDTFPSAIALDLYSDKSLKPMTPDQPPIPPCPILWILNTSGMLFAYNILSTVPLEKGIAYPFMLKPSDFNTSSIAKKMVLEKNAKPSYPFANSNISQDSAKSTPATADSTISSNASDCKPNDKLAIPVFGKPTQAVEKTDKITSVISNSAQEPSKSVNHAVVSSDIVDNGFAQAELLGQFNRAYEDFELDILNLKNFFGDLLNDQNQMLSNTESQEKFNSSEASQMNIKANDLIHPLLEIQYLIDKIQDEFDGLKTKLLNSWSKKEESASRLELLNKKNLEPAPEVSQVLGPEAAEMRQTIELKKRIIEGSLSDFSEVLQDTRDRISKQKIGRKVLGASRDWYTLCKTVQRVTCSAITANCDLDYIEKKMNQMSIFSSPSAANQVGRKQAEIAQKSPYGIVSTEDALGVDVQFIKQSPAKQKENSRLFSYFSSPKFKISLTQSEARKSIFKYGARNDTRKVLDINPSKQSNDQSYIETQILNKTIKESAGYNIKIHLDDKIHESGPQTLEEKFKKLQSTPPTKPETIEAHLGSREECLQNATKKGMIPTNNSIRTQAEFSIPSPIISSGSSAKIRDSIKGPDFSGISDTKPSGPFKFALPVNDSPLSNPFQGFNTTDDKENPFLITAKPLGKSDTPPAMFFKDMKPKVNFVPKSEALFKVPAPNVEKPFGTQNQDKGSFKDAFQPLDSKKEDLVSKPKEVSESKIASSINRKEVSSTDPGKEVKKDSPAAESSFSEELANEDDIEDDSSSESMMKSADEELKLLDKSTVEGISLESTSFFGEESSQEKVDRAKCDSPPGFSSVVTTSTSSNVFGIRNADKTAETSKLATTLPSLGESELSTSAIDQMTAQPPTTGNMINPMQASVFNSSTPTFASFGAPTLNSLPSNVPFGHSSSSASFTLKPEAPMFVGFGSSALGKTTSATSTPQPSFGSSSPFGAPQSQIPSFAPQSQPSLGQSNFGNIPALTQNTPAQTNQPSSFFNISNPSTAGMPLGPGQALAGNVAFGSSSGLGMNAPTLGFGQPAFPNINTSTQSVFGASSFGSNTVSFGNPPNSAANSGFAAFGSSASSQPTFGQGSGFGSLGSQTSVFGGNSATSAFGTKPTNNPSFSQYRG